MAGPSIVVGGDIDALNKKLNQIKAIAKRPHEHVKPETRKKFLVRVRYTIGRYPGAVRYPIEWDSEKQRRAYFASNGFGGGIPYRRSRNFDRQWAEEAKDSTFTFKNRSPRSSFIVGEDQQPFHANTGWVTAADKEPELIDTFTQMAGDDVFEAIRTEF
ncbi:hypothetical protein G4Y79_05210 [Phototrophicus methaneseepsis]|uniref:Phage protein n=1 Tax=Phototrophicus methaneseepsis TaxID=2710758 RepID=A0A7S8EBF8_9CHLR|nr:hypothetical protein [Phototrophicus methaneseepsis]QPC83779.1 hypothetical protein G4Y79_05210 [Phototrophicus methaneseepsis]